MNLNSQAVCASPSHQSSSSLRKRRIIRKAQKCNLLLKSSRRGYSYARVRNNAKLHKNSKTIGGACVQAYDILPSIFSQFVEQNPASLKKSITSIIQQFPTLPSIDQLFSLASQRSLEANIDLVCLLRYARICSLIDYADANPILLLTESQAGILVVGKQQASQNSCVFGMTLSKCEASLCQKMSIFMEKLRKNESKYDSSLGRMSQISKQLAFAYRIYLETRNQIVANLNGLAAESSYIQRSLQLVRKNYARLLITKNLRHTFEDCQLDQMNYFKLREYIETNRVQQFQGCSSLNQFQSFMKKRRPKRGRKYPLATACSVCLSDYYQLNNPLSNCQGCGLRAHRLCHSFERKKCGYCNYQKLQRQVKKQVEWCMICRKAGLMVIKIDELHYTHGFCLLVHGFWGVKMNAKSVDFQCQAPHEASSFELNCCGQERCDKQEMEIEFQNPQKYTIKLQKQNRNVEQQILIQEHSFDLLQPSFPHFNHFQEVNLENWQRQLQDQNRQDDCKCCGAPFFHKCYVSCDCCGKKYHALCAFLAGFKLQIQEGEFLKGENNLLLVDCCSVDYSKVGRNRRYKLNYQRCAFYMNGEQLVQREQPQLWVERAESLFK